MPCIYCGRTEGLSESDIIPDSMTNGKILNPNICKIEHNSKFSDEFESYVFDKLAFILNCLDIKSSKAKNYPKYNTRLVIENETYDVRNINKELDVLSRNVLKSEDGTSFLGDPESLKSIAKSKGFSPEDVSYEDINGKELTFKNDLHYEVFFESQMFRLIAKIAFEWYCLRNDIDDYHDDFEAITDFITTGLSNQDSIVTVVTDEDVLKILDEFADDGGHVLIAYKDKDGGISVLVDFLTICVYKVKICDHIPEFCINNMIVQYISIDGSGNRIEDCLCTSDINGLQEVFIDYVLGNSKIEICGSIKQNTYLGLTDNKNFNRLRLFALTNGLLGLFKAGFVGITRINDEIKGHIFGRLENILQKNTVHPKALKRFVKDHDIKENIRLNSKGSNSKDAFLFYILYKIGDSKVDTLNNDVIMKLLNGLYRNAGEICVNEEVTHRILNELLADPEYGKKIVFGARIALKWEE